MPHFQTTNANLVLGTVLLLSAVSSGCSRNHIDQSPMEANNVAASLSLFEQVTRGFPTCEMGNLFVDEYTQTTSNSYLQAIEGRRCDISDMLVTYCIDEKYEGLSVTRLAVPRTTMPVFALYFDVELEEARSTLMAKFGTNFSGSPASRIGAQPELIRDPADASASVLICTKPD